jgi:HD-like signal output (HDOD) protein
MQNTKVIPPAASGDTVLFPVKLCNLPPLPIVAGKLISLSEGECQDLQRVVSLVGGDPALAAEILFLANSSLFGFPARIDSLRHAVAVLGFDGVQRLAMTVVMRELARGAGPFVRSSWCHSVACAVIAEKIAPLLGCSAGQSYTAGLMHDIGRLGFLRSYSSEICPSLSGEFEDADEVMAAERAVLNTTHQEAGAWLIEYWALPRAFSDFCAHHHDPLGPDDAPILRVVKTACRLANAAGYSAVRYTQRRPYADVLESTLADIPVESWPTEEAMQEEVELRLRIFDSSSGRL